MLGKIDLKLVHLIRIQSPRRSVHLNNPPLEIVRDLVLEAGGGVDLPFDELLLEPVARDLAQGLARRGRRAGHRLERESEGRERERKREKEREERGRRERAGF